MFVVIGVVAHLGERDAGSVEVAGSIPVSSTMKEFVEEKVFGERYFHISNSGVNFSIVDQGYGPTIRISSSAFGNLVHVLEVNVSQECLTELAIMFAEASKKEYSSEYCNKAEYLDNKKTVCYDSST